MSAERVNRFVLGELIGTFLLVFFGCGTVILAIAYGAVNLFEVASLWGLGLTVAILLTGSLSGAHLNPAISLAFATRGKLAWKLLPWYIVAQLIGATFASVVLYLLFSGAIHEFEQTNQITRGTPGSEASAMMFGEFFPNPDGQSLGSAALERAHFWRAMLAELLGTALLAFSIFSLIHPKNIKQPNRLTALWIGITLAVLIALLAPISQAGFNPARDLAPRIVSSFLGWGEIPFTTNGSGWFWVYILAPCIGGPLGARLADSLFDS